MYQFQYPVFRIEAKSTAYSQYTYLKTDLYHNNIPWCTFDYSKSERAASSFYFRLLLFDKELPQHWRFSWRTQSPSIRFNCLSSDFCPVTFIYKNTANHNSLGINVINYSENKFVPITLEEYSNADHTRFVRHKFFAKICQMLGAA